MESFTKRFLWLLLIKKIMLALPHAVAWEFCCKVPFFPQRGSVIQSYFAAANKGSLFRLDRLSGCKIISCVLVNKALKSCPFNIKPILAD